MTGSPFTRRWARAGGALALTAAAAVGFVTAVGPPASAGTASATLSGPLDPLGINTAAWDGDFADSAIAADLSAAGTGLVRYPGGSTADEYLWQSNTVSGSTEPLDFARYSSQVDAIAGGQKFVTVDYGSDAPADAADWVTQSETSGEGVSLWEIGNEEYGSWETDDHSDPHTATSYATNALSYMQATKAVDPNAQICYDYAMDGNLAAGSGVSGWQNWNDTILQADAADINCADVHWYPVDGTPTESVESILATVDDNADPSVVRSTLSGSTVAVPAESIVVLTGGSGAPTTSGLPSASPTPSVSASCDGSTPSHEVGKSAAANVLIV